MGMVLKNVSNFFCFFTAQHVPQGYTLIDGHGFENVCRDFYSFIHSIVYRTKYFCKYLTSRVATPPFVYVYLLWELPAFQSSVTCNLLNKSILLASLSNLAFELITSTALLCDIPNHERLQYMLSITILLKKKKMIKLQSVRNSFNNLTRHTNNVRSNNTISVYIPRPFPPVWGLADNTKRKQKHGGFTLFF